jgi:hypothetical protein
LFGRVEKSIVLSLEKRKYLGSAAAAMLAKARIGNEAQLNAAGLCRRLWRESATADRPSSLAQLAQRRPGSRR